MMGMRPFTVLLPVLLALLSPDAGWGSSPTPGTTLTFRITGEPETLDWNRAHTPVENYLMINLMEGLVAFDEKLHVIPALAESWDLSADGRIYRFHLRKGVSWSDGVPLRAQDFVYSWKRLLSPATAAAYAYFLHDIEGAEDFNRGKNPDFSKVGVRALDDRTLEVRLRQRVAHWISLPTFWVTFPLREDIVTKYGQDDWARPGRMVTVGPYVLSAHDTDRRVVLSANPRYYGKRGNIDQVVALIVKDDSTALNLYEAGRLDFLTDLSAIDLQRLEKRADLRKFPYLKTGYLGFVVDRFPVSNPRLRRAIALAIDKAKLGEILRGGQEPARSFVPPGMLAHSREVGLPFDVSRAKSELRASGLDLARPISLDLVIPNWEKALTLAQFIQGELKRNLGLDVVLQPYDNKTFRAQVDLRANPLFILSWGADYPDPDNFLSVWLGDAGNNRTRFKSARYDELVIRARALASRAEREKMYLQAQRILLEEEIAIVPLYYEPNLALVRPRVSGLVLSPLNYLYLRQVSVAASP